MKILALEFSANERSVAVAEARPDETPRILSSIHETDFRGVTGLTLIDRALQCATVKPVEISLIATGLGPGSYTGIRSAIALAQGWQLSRGTPVVGISTIFCLAEQARAKGIRGLVDIVVDAQRQELYVARYQIEGEEAREIEPLRIIAPADLPPADHVIGPEASKFVVGALDLAPCAETIARLAPSSKIIASEQLEPIYLRQAIFVKAPPPRHIA